MNSNNSATADKSPASTGKFFTTEIVYPQQASQSQRVVTSDSPQVRIDNPLVSRKPHYRAQQLEEFTSWLMQSEAMLDELSSNPAPSLSDEYMDDIRIEKLFRVDSGAINVQLQSSDGVARNAANSSAASTTKSGPHFPTAGYRPPSQKPRTAIDTTAPVRKQVEDITEDFDPTSGVRGKVSELKQKNNIIGKLQQPRSLSTASWEVPSFIWPVITDQLLDEPGGSIASLSNSVAGMMSESAKRLAITGTGDGVGCTTIAMCIARRIAKQGKRVLLVDADLAQPKLAVRVGLQQRLSWLQALSKRRRIGEVVVSSALDPICIMPLAPIVTGESPGGAKIFDNLGRMLDALSSEFDLIVLDTGNAMQMISETTAPEVIADGVVLVSSDNLTPAVEFQRTQAGLLSFGVKRMVVAQNFKNLERLEPALVG